MKGRSELRAIVFERDGNRCLWPNCPNVATELAHIHSVGMGGKHGAADSPANCFAACWSHGRISDGEYGLGGSVEYRGALLALLGERLLDIPQSQVAWHRAEALVSLVASRYSGQDNEEGL